MTNSVQYDIDVASIEDGAISVDKDERDKFENSYNRLLLINGKKAFE